MSFCVCLVFWGAAFQSAPIAKAILLCVYFFSIASRWANARALSCAREPVAYVGSYPQLAASRVVAGCSNISNLGVEVAQYHGVHGLGMEGTVNKFRNVEVAQYGPELEFTWNKCATVEVAQCNRMCGPRLEFQAANHHKAANHTSNLDNMFRIACAPFGAYSQA